MPLGEHLISTNRTHLIYKENPLLILGMPGNVPFAKLRSLASEKKIRLGVKSSDRTLWGQIDQALSNLNAPRHRLLYEIFWYSVDAEKDIAEMNTALANPNEELWKQFTSWEKKSTDSNPGTRGHALHNLAVHCHSLAISKELESGSPDETHWQKALSSWESLLKNDWFWQTYLKGRIDAMDARELRTENVANLRRQVSHIILRVNIELATKYVGKKDIAPAAFHTKIIFHPIFGGQANKEAADILISFKKRLGDICGKGKELMEKKPEEVLKGFSMAKEQVEGELEAIKRLDPNGKLFQGVLDDVARFLNQLTVRYFEAAKDAQQCAKMLDWLVSLPISESVRIQIEENRKACIDLEKGSICWFCNERPHKGRTFKVSMHQETERTSYQVRWKTADMPVPICKKCSSAWIKKTVGGSLMFTVAILWIVGLVADSMDPTSTLADTLPFVALGLSFPFGIAGIILLCCKSRAKGRANDHPLIKQGLKEGWHLGAKPSGVS